MKYPQDLGDVQLGRLPTPVWWDLFLIGIWLKSDL